MVICFLARAFAFCLFVQLIPYVFIRFNFDIGFIVLLRVCPFDLEVFEVHGERFALACLSVDLGWARRIRSDAE